MNGLSSYASAHTYCNLVKATALGCENYLTHQALPRARSCELVQKYSLNICPDKLIPHSKIDHGVVLLDQVDRIVLRQALTLEEETTKLLVSMILPAVSEDQNSCMRVLTEYQKVVILAEVAGLKLGDF